MAIHNECLELGFAKRHHEDLIREAATERMVREAMHRRTRPAPFYTRTLRWVSQRLIAWGSGLLKRFDGRRSEIRRYPLTR